MGGGVQRYGKFHLLDGRDGRTDDGDSKRYREYCKNKARSHHVLPCFSSRLCV